MDTPLQERARAWAGQLRADAAALYADNPDALARIEVEARRIEHEGGIETREARTRPAGRSVPRRGRPRFVLHDAGQAGEPADRELWQERRRRRVTVRQLWHEFCAAGCAPAEGLREEELQAIAEQLHDRLSRLARAGSGGERALFAGAPLAVPAQWFGFSQTFMPCEGDLDETAVYGRMLQTVGDFAELGAGTTRRYGHPNVVWENVMRADGKSACGPPETGSTIGAMVPAPTEVYERMHAALQRERAFWQFTFVCWLSEVGFCPTLLSLGGGGPFDSPGVETFPEYVTEAIGNVTQLYYTWQASDKPFVLTTQGFDLFYWDFNDPSLGSGGWPEPTDLDEVTYAQTVLNVWAPDSASDYLRESARRKALMVAAYAQAVGGLAGRRRPVPPGPGGDVHRPRALPRAPERDECVLPARNSDRDIFGGDLRTRTPRRAARIANSRCYPDGSVPDVRDGVLGGVTAEYSRYHPRVHVLVVRDSHPNPNRCRHHLAILGVLLGVPPRFRLLVHR